METGTKLSIDMKYICDRQQTDGGLDGQTDTRSNHSDFLSLLSSFSTSSHFFIEIITEKGFRSHLHLYTNAHCTLKHRIWYGTQMKIDDMHTFPFCAAKRCDAASIRFGPSVRDWILKWKCYKTSPPPRPKHTPIKVKSIKSTACQAR